MNELQYMLLAILNVVCIKMFMPVPFEFKLWLNNRAHLNKKHIPLLVYLVISGIYLIGSILFFIFSLGD